ncbi:MAG: hypothetical protein CTY15_08055 [Methylocystis sp.]|nr:MAG: hypothetical protein CTY15_08055 [Methylocystis sp.]
MDINFDPFDAAWPVVDHGEKRGMIVPAANAALAVMGLTLVIFLALYVTEAPELAPLLTNDAVLRRYAEAGYFPLAAAANTAGRHALAAGANVQTFGCLVAIFMAFAYGGWRGFSSSRARGWSNAFWVVAVVGISFAPKIFDGLSLQMLDYFVTSAAHFGGRANAGGDAFGHGLNAVALPAVLLIERGLAAAVFAAVFILLGHDMGYRLREALCDFGLIAEEESRSRREKPTPFKSKGGARRATDDSEAAQAGDAGFGQRNSQPPRDAAMSADARARAVLGVGMSATKREIERAYRSQIKRAHPDHGGSVERAAALNAARDALLRRG